MHFITYVAINRTHYWSYICVLINKFLLIDSRTYSHIIQEEFMIKLILKIILQHYMFLIQIEIFIFKCILSAKNVNNSNMLKSIKELDNLKF